MIRNETCVTGKKVYENESIAIEALIQHHIMNEFGEKEGPINVYSCLECGNWHFTSKGPKNDIFEDVEVVQRIKKERLAFQWERKLK